MDLLLTAKLIFAVSFMMIVISSLVVFSKLDQDPWLDCEEDKPRSLKDRLSSIGLKISCLGLYSTCILFALHCYFSGIYFLAIALILVPI